MVAALKPKLLLLSTFKTEVLVTILPSSFPSSVTSRYSIAVE